MNKHRIIITIIGLVAVGLISIGVFMIFPSQQTSKVNTNKLTAALWQSYLKNQWLSEGRTVSNPVNSITTSEGQSYTMLRAVWQNDQNVFNTTWQWTKTNLQRSDHLFSWEWGRNSNGSYGIMTANNGQNTAADADCDIALALLMASQRWHKANYKHDAISIIQSIWNVEVVKINGLYYLAADNIEKTAATPYIVVNPSYFSPASYRIFDKVDPHNQWLALAKDTYPEINSMSQSTLGSKSTDNLPPDWITVNRKTGTYSPSPNHSQTTNFGFNAFRTIYRVALDYQWNHINAAKNTLNGFSYLAKQYKTTHSLAAIYNHNGNRVVDYSSYALYGGTLGYFEYNHPSIATNIINTKLIANLFNNKTGQLKTNVDYYDNNWVWFGLKLYSHQLPDLAGRISQ